MISNGKGGISCPKKTNKLQKLKTLQQKGLFPSPAVNVKKPITLKLEQLNFSAQRVKR
jgi:hypothetical protein